MVAERFPNDRGERLMYKMTNYLPSNLLGKRTLVLQFIMQGLSDMDIQRITNVDHKTIKKYRNLWQSGKLFSLENKIGSPTKKSNDLVEYIDSITKINRRMSNEQVSKIIKDNPKFENVSATLVRQIRQELGYKFLPPIRTFILTQQQKVARLNFCLKHIQEKTNWDNVLFTDESYFWLGEDYRPLYRKRGEHCREVEVHEKKFPEKVLVFGGISKRCKTNLIILERGTVDSLTYIDDLIDGSGLIPAMNNIYKNGWVLMQDGASAHTSFETMDYLKNYVNVLEDWPSMSPDLNPIENLWSIMKQRVFELQPKTKEDLIASIIAVWESITQELISNLINSMPERLKEVVKNNGDHINY